MEQRLAELTKKEMTASMIAKQLCFDFDLQITRNAVIGKAKRLKLDISDKGTKRIFWNAERIDELRTMIGSGMTYKIIGQHFGRSDNAIRAKCSELGISNGLTNFDAKIVNRRNSYIQWEEKKDKTAKERAAYFKEYNMRALNERKQANKNKPVIYKITHEISYHNPEARKLTFMQLKSNQCHFPTGHPKEDTLRYCGADVDPKSSLPYCEICRNVMYIPAKKVMEKKDYRT